ncbi:MAG: hypothetical protein RLY31_52 [Bacteroidota bacterium]|jgi:ribonuclease HI
MASQKKQRKYYVVWKGARPGIYESWEDCRAQVAGFPGAAYRSFPTREAATLAFREPPPAEQNPRKGHGGSAKTGGRIPRSNILLDSISVDAACSGNPGVMEYQGVDTRTGNQLFHQRFDLGTNNIGEFLAIVHALAMLQQQGSDRPVYTDSKNAMLWVRKKSCKTTLPRHAGTERLFQLIDRAEQWLRTHTWTNPILKWETESWGEIPADFGRK